MNAGRLRRALLIAGPGLWLGVFFAAPFVIVMTIGLAESVLGVPPYGPLLRWTAENVLTIQVDFQNFVTLFSDDYYAGAYLRSLRVAGISAALCLLIAYPMALAIARAQERHRNLLLMLVMLPFWTSFLLRISAWIGLLKDDGLINQALLALGLIQSPLVLLYTDFALFLGIVYCYLPFAILPLYANLVKLDPILLEAAADLGARPVRSFLAVTLPLSMPGVIAGFLLVFIPAAGEFVIPELLGGPDAQLIGRVLWGEFFTNRDWPLASSLATVLLLLLVVPIALFQAGPKRGGPR